MTTKTAAKQLQFFYGGKQNYLPNLHTAAPNV
jgi:hypothetical protein